MADDNVEDQIDTHDTPILQSRETYLGAIAVSAKRIADSLAYIVDQIKKDDEKNGKRK